MRRAILLSVVFGLLLIPMQSAFPSNALKYSNQKAGTTCKKNELNKFVILPNKSVLICVSSSKKFVWKRYTTSPPTPTTKPVYKLVTLGAWGETNFGKFAVAKKFSLASVGLETQFGAGTVYLIVGCLQSWQPPNPIGFSFSESSWSAIDVTGSRVSVATLVGPTELYPAYPSVYSDQILQPGDCVSGHIVFFGTNQIAELNYVDRTLGGNIRFSVN
jgi:hypothetical protein